MIKPLMVLLPDGKRRPSLAAPALVPLISIMGVPAYPGWVAPSITTGSVMDGKALVGLMVRTPVPGI